MIVFFVLLDAKIQGEVIMKFILGTLLALTSAVSVASTGNCKIDGYASKNHRSAEVYRFFKLEKAMTLEQCEAKLQQTARAVENCLIVPMSDVAHIQMTFAGEKIVKDSVSVSVFCAVNYEN